MSVSIGNNFGYIYMHKSYVLYALVNNSYSALNINNFNIHFSLSGAWLMAKNNIINSINENTYLSVQFVDVDKMKIVKFVIPFVR